ncbi:hypothetical protein BSL78_18733 [Apostichopus japonicus]|uniref:BAI1-associated protein 3 n=1 Tax=Stichopus japonicus TaxID=307972 RepID=A0A2G8K8X0_STIJA|nr:hypothetical protein BSL78_18733 [Apostichopus japonicus]
MAEVQEKCSDIPHLSTRETEALYSSTLFSILHRLGVKGEKATPPKQQLFLYLQSVMDISKENHQNHLDAAKQMEPPISVLTVTVIGAKGLVPKDSNGKSDPFCMIGCIPADSRRTGIAAANCIPKDVRPLLLEKHLSAELVQVTSVQKKTLEPLWNESFQFEIENTDDHVLQVEVWDHDEETSILETVKNVGNVPNLKSMGRFFKEVAKTSRRSSTSTNDFEGVIVIPLKEIPSNGKEDWFPLHSKTSKKYYGEVKLRLRWRHKSFQHALHIVTAEQVLQILWYKSIHYEVSSRRKQHGKDTWDGQVSALSKSLLMQYAAQHEISLEQEAVSQWIAYSQPCCLPSLEYKTFLSILKKLSCSSNPVIYDSDKPIVRGCLHRFITMSISRLQKQRTVFPCNDVDALTKLSVLLNCLNETYILDKGLQLQLYQAGLKPSIIAAIKADCCDSYALMKSEMEKEIPTDETCRDVTLLARLMENMKNYVERDLKLVTHVYKKVVSLDYQDIVHRQIGDLAMQDVRQALDVAIKSTLSPEESLDASSSMFQLYQSLTAFNTAYVCQETQEEPTPTAKFYLVFKKTVQRWFDVTRQESLQRITKAVELDKMNTMDSIVKHSTSAVDATGCIKVFSDFWNKLNWPDPAGAYVFATCVTDYICNCGLEYGHLIHAKLTANGFYDTVGRFDVSDQLCIAINNLEEVRQYLASLYETLRLDKVVAALEKEHGQRVR